MHAPQVLLGPKQYRTFVLSADTTPISAICCAEHDTVHQGRHGLLQKTAASHALSGAACLHSRCRHKLHCGSLCPTYRHVPLLLVPQGSSNFQKLCRAKLSLLLLHCCASRVPLTSARTQCRAVHQPCHSARQRVGQPHMKQHRSRHPRRSPAASSVCNSLTAVGQPAMRHSWKAAAPMCRRDSKLCVQDGGKG